MIQAKNEATLDETLVAILIFSVIANTIKMVHFIYTNPCSVPPDSFQS